MMLRRVVRARLTIDDLPLEVVDVVLGGLDARLVLLDPEVDLGVDPGVEVVVGDDLLGRGVDHHLGDVDLAHLLDDRDDPVEARHAEPVVPAQALDEPPVGRPDDPDAQQEDENDSAGDPKINGHVPPPSRSGQDYVLAHSGGEK